MQAERAHAQYPQPRGVVLLEAEDEEEDLDMGGTKLFVIIVDIQKKNSETTLILHRHVHIVKHWTTLQKSVYR